MSLIRETCGCGATWEGGSAFREERMRFREAHAPCRERDQAVQQERDRLLSADSLRAVAKHRHNAEQADGFDDRTWDDLPIEQQMRSMNAAKADLLVALDQEGDGDG